jgi:hypothetical protein
MNIRLDSRQMPPLATEKIDPGGVGAVRVFIMGLPPPP